ncbi:hypothetical protein [Thalassovita aquimarina]|uniref:Uncharacterized protein n=1 Tax=Thalassovita aquimarina TaxID=2785917 RepID=A0ABS5HU63_9RHOB|nr:hypothetical protein [Thalassovita aquimarina]MBR9652327.1 hypothetical protein [Thalassovita aquimarina]
MNITRIEVSQMIGGRETGRVSGFVSLHSYEGHVQMHCAVYGTTPSTCRDALIAEALRQLGRMPEFRSGARSFSCAPGILAAQTAHA